MVCLSVYSIISVALISRGVASLGKCKLTPSDACWPSIEAWGALNISLDGRLIKAEPVASSCWPGNPFNSVTPCEAVKSNWSLATFHSSLPESIDAPVWANNSCLPLTASGYSVARGCELGELPEYVLNASTESQIATALSWATSKNIRVVVKGTGHDLNGSGAYSLSIWTHNFNVIQQAANWNAPNGEMENVLVVGSGNVWGDLVAAAEMWGRVVVGGGDKTVGLGGFIQGGGHGPLSSTYGLAANQVLQVRVVTTNGTILVADEIQNQDLFFAFRGGGAGQYGVVTEYVIKTYPAPETVTLGSLQILPSGNSSILVNASWAAAATILSSIPDLMESGLTGQGSLATGPLALNLFPTLKQATSAVAFNQVFWGYNLSAASLTSRVHPLVAQLQSQFKSTGLQISWSEPVVYLNFTSFFTAIGGVSNSAGAQSLLASRLLGRSELVDISQKQLATYIQRSLRAQNETAGSLAVVGLQGGPGPANVSDSSWGSVNPAWRSAYIHLITTGADIDSTTIGPEAGLNAAGSWLEQNIEALFREWAPFTGAYMNEANPFNTEWKRDFYGHYYGRLLEIKSKYDPTTTLFTLNGVGSDEWDYDLNSGKLCRVQ